MKYQESQIGWILLIVQVPILIFLFFAFQNQWGDKPLPFIPFLLVEGLLIFVVLLFYKLTVSIKKNEIILAYGIGLVKRKIQIKQLIEAKSIKTPWYYGLGIRFTPKGMLYNIHGLKAVKLDYYNGKENKTVMIGSAEPDLLKAAIKRNISS